MSQNLISPELLESYISYTNGYLDTIQKLLDRLLSEKEESPQIRKDIFSTCHDIKGMGGSFNYPLMTEAGASICNYFRNLSSESRTDTDILEAHIKTMRVIIENKITGPGDKTSEQLIKRLNDLVQQSLS